MSLNNFSFEKIISITENRNPEPISEHVSSKRTYFQSASLM